MPKAPKTLTHKTITVTAKFLRAIGACDSAIDDLNHYGLLPAKVSTDPEENIGLALNMIEADVAWRWGWLLTHAAYFASQEDQSDYWDVAQIHHTGIDPAISPMLVAQALAIFADRYLTWSRD